ncbi:helix-turn-helix domain-containing protein [Timonella sp. A28]|uniref:helix-turn-helix domain-containing protein n=1 Tax=Timonella sp. A28 TaxID=3442640 RepID=UPI003EB74713
MVDINDLVQLGSYVRDIRVRRKMSQTELAEQVGTTRQWLSRFEQGNNDVSVGIVFKILEALDVRLSCEDNASDAQKVEKYEPEADKTPMASSPVSPLSVIPRSPEPGKPQDRFARLRLRDSLSGLRMPGQAQSSGGERIVPPKKTQPNDAVQRGSTSAARPSGSYSMDRDIERISQSSLFKNKKKKS